jgi:hypothetical protein
VRRILQGHLVDSGGAERGESLPGARHRFHGQRSSRSCGASHGKT